MIRGIMEDRQDDQRQIVEERTVVAPKVEERYVTEERHHYREAKFGNEKIFTKFIDKEGTLVNLEAELQQNRNYPMEFSMMGDISGGGAGQMLDSIVPADKWQKLIVDFWHDHHLSAITPAEWKSIKTMFNIVRIEGGEDITDYDNIEAFGDDPKIAALAKYLELDADEASNISGDGTDYNLGKASYIVATDEEADELAKEREVQTLEEIGIEGINIDTSQYVNEEWFKDAERESFEFYVDDIENEGNRLKEELERADLIDEDEDLDEDGEIKDIEKKKEEYIEYHMNDITDFVEHYKNNFGEEDFRETVKRENLVDFDALAEEIIRIDGRGNTLNGYDGNEEEVDIDGTTYYIYRN